MPRSASPNPPNVASLGEPGPLGATPGRDGVNFAVWAPLAERVEVCLFDLASNVEFARVALPGRTGPVAHGHLTGVGIGAGYGYRAGGRFDPAQGLRHDPSKLLLDPCALAIDRPLQLHPEMMVPGADTGPLMAKAVVCDIDLPPPRPVRRLWGERLVYELHVRGFTRRLAAVPEAIRGTFAGLAHPAAIDHLKSLGVTAVELMPAMAWIDERHLGPLGLTNYWGYNPVAWLCPDPRLAPGGWREVREATDRLTEAGIETLLDVVLNHTGEGDALGPTLCHRGLDNAGYYRLRPADLSGYVDDTGTGNTVALDCDPGLGLALRALRAWRRLGGVSGFRFDLATVMGRTDDGFDASAPLLHAIEADPELKDLVLIAEPWDIGPGGYQLGRFPKGWGEWNDSYRDTMRRFWRGDPVSLGQFATRFAGSSDLFAARSPSRSVNFITAHDGFTLADLVSHTTKHNAANGEANRDGTDQNHSWNQGAEGPTDDPRIRSARAADARALLATLLVSRGTPMLSMGDEIGRTQGGNNNAYAQDNEVSWMDWDGADQALLAFTARLTAMRANHPVLRDDRFLTGEGQPADVAWLTPKGAPMTPRDWDDPTGETLVIALHQPGDTVCIIVHRGLQPVEADLPRAPGAASWRIDIDTGDPARTGPAPGPSVGVAPRSIVILATDTASEFPLSNAGQSIA